MCGIVAFTGKKNFNPKTIQALLSMNQYRGIDSWGHCSLLRVDEKKVEHHSRKKIGRVVDDINDLTLIPSNTFIGHVRAATRGNSSEVKNAHPFMYKNSTGGLITGVHNGTIENYTDIQRYFNKEKFTEKDKEHNKGKNLDFDVDSQLLFFSLISLGNYEVLEKIHGGTAFAAMVYEDLIIYNNGGRTLYSGESEEGIYFSSLKPPLSWLGLKDVKEVEINKVHTYVDGIKIKEKAIVQQITKFTFSFKSSSESKAETTGNFTSMRTMKDTLTAIKNLVPKGKVFNEAIRPYIYYDVITKDFRYLHGDQKVRDDVVWKNVFQLSPGSGCLFPYDEENEDFDFAYGFSAWDDSEKKEEVVKNSEKKEEVVKNSYSILRKKGFSFNYNNEQDKIIMRKFLTTTFSQEKLESVSNIKLKGEIPARDFTWGNGLKAVLTDNFIRKISIVDNMRAYYDPTLDVFILSTLYMGGSFIEEEIVNFSSLFGMSKDKYVSDYVSPENKKEKSVVQKLIDLLKDCHDTINSLREEAEVLNKDIVTFYLEGTLKKIDTSMAELVEEEVFKVLKEHNDD